MKWIIFLALLSVNIPSLWARSGGAPQEACADLMPQHMGAMNNPNTNGFLIQSPVIDNQGTYDPGQTYEGKMICMVLRA